MKASFRDVITVRELPILKFLLSQSKNIYFRVLLFVWKNLDLLAKNVWVSEGFLYWVVAVMLVAYEKKSILQLVLAVSYAILNVLIVYIQLGKFKSVKVRPCKNSLRQILLAVVRMKPDRRRILINTLGVFQVFFGIMFLTLGTWALLEHKMSIYKTAAAPFWMSGLCFFGGYLSIATPKQYHKQWLQVLMYTTMSLFLIATAIASWMLAQLLRFRNEAVVSYTSMAMGLNILLMIDTAVTALAAWSAIQHRNRSRNRTQSCDPPPAYYENRMVFFGDEEFGPPPVNTFFAPPPYEP